VTVILVDLSEVMRDDVLAGYPSFFTINSAAWRSGGVMFGEIILKVSVILGTTWVGAKMVELALTYALMPKEMQ
jgi:hypothetical protein